MAEVQVVDRGPVVRRFTRSCAQGLPNEGDVIVTTARRLKMRYTVTTVNSDRVVMMWQNGIESSMRAGDWSDWCRRNRVVRELRS